MAKMRRREVIRAVVFGALAFVGGTAAGLFLAKDQVCSLWLGALTTLVTEAMLAFSWVNARSAAAAREDKEKAEYAAAKANAKLKTLSAQYEHILARYQAAKQFFGRDLPELYTDHRLVGWLKSRALSDASIVSGLVGPKAPPQKYRHQLLVAELIAEKVTKRLWTTSTDRPSVMWARNFYYFASLAHLTAAIPSRYDETGMPQLARIFVGRSQEFLDDVRSGWLRLSELYFWHLQWLREKGERAGLRLFLYETPDEYLKFYENAGIAPEKRIEDFLVSDSERVYGRRGAESLDHVELQYLEDQDVVSAYETLYRELWRNSLTIWQLMDRLRDEFGRIPEIDALAEACKKEESKLAVERDYEGTFAPHDRRGPAFFNRVCLLMGSAEALCLAVDRADRKGSLWQWDNNAAYQKFKEASKKAASRTEFKRVFILESAPLTKDRQRAIEFADEFVEAGISIAFLLRSEAKLENMGVITEEMDSDFVLVNIADTTFRRTDGALGFELQSEEFKVPALEWTKNLIAFERFQTHYRIWDELWERRTESIIKIPARSSRQVVEKAIDRLIAKGTNL